MGMSGLETLSSPQEMFLWIPDAVLLWKKTYICKGVHSHLKTRGRSLWTKFNIKISEYNYPLEVNVYPKTCSSLVLYNPIMNP